MEGVICRCLATEKALRLSRSHVPAAKSPLIQVTEDVLQEDTGADVAAPDEKHVRTPEGTFPP